MRADGDQAKTACGNLQMCAGLEVVIEGGTHNVVQRRLESLRQRRSEEDVRGTEEWEDTESVAAVLGNLNLETAGTEEEAADEGLKAALVMEIDEEGGDESEGK